VVIGAFDTDPGKERDPRSFGNNPAHFVHQMPVMESQPDLSIHVIEFYRRLMVPGVHDKSTTPRTPHFFSDLPKTELLQRLNPLRVQPLTGKPLFLFTGGIRLQKGYRLPGQTKGTGRGTTGRPTPHHDDVKAVTHDIFVTKVVSIILVDSK
jgi:hypothetical protein